VDNEQIGRKRGDLLVKGPYRVKGVFPGPRAVDKLNAARCGPVPENISVSNLYIVSCRNAAAADEQPGHAMYFV
jgi:hypothetical protein